VLAPGALAVAHRRDGAWRAVGLATAPSAWEAGRSSGSEGLMRDVILIMGMMLSTAGLLRAPRMRRQRPCREDDTAGDAA